MSTTTFPVANVKVPCAKIAYDLSTDTAAGLLAAITSVLLTNFAGWTQFDTFGTTSVFKKTIGGTDRYVEIEVDFSGMIEMIRISASSGWDAPTDMYSGSLYTRHHHEVMLGTSPTSDPWSFFVYDSPDSDLYVEIIN